MMIRWIGDATEEVTHLAIRRRAMNEHHVRWRRRDIDNKAHVVGLRAHAAGDLDRDLIANTRRRGERAVVATGKRRAAANDA